MPNVDGYLILFIQLPWLTPISVIVPLYFSAMHIRH